MRDAQAIGIVIIAKNDATFCFVGGTGTLRPAIGHIGPECSIFERVANTVQQAIRTCSDSFVEVVRLYHHRIIAGGRNLQLEISVVGGGEEVQRIVGLRRGEQERIYVVTAGKARIPGAVIGKTG